MSGVGGAPGPGGADGVGDTAGVSPPVDMETLLMSVQIERAKNLDTQLAMQAGEVKARNDQVAELNTLMTRLRAEQSDSDDTGKIRWTDYATVVLLEKYGLVQNDPHYPASVPSPYSKPGEPVGGWGFKRSTTDLFLDRAKGAVDKLNSSNQMDMIRLQSLMNKRNESFDMLTNLVEKFSKQQSNIVGNLR
jgi:hypothetical protein